MLLTAFREPVVMLLVSNENNNKKPQCRSRSSNLNFFGAGTKEEVVRV